jgi:hypothetical protein
MGHAILRKISFLPLMHIVFVVCKTSTVFRSDLVMH